LKRDQELVDRALSKTGKKGKREKHCGQPRPALGKIGVRQADVIRNLAAREDKPELVAT